MMLNRSRFCFRLAILAILALTPALHSAEEDSSAKDGYTINYNTISIIEYIKFASKICNVNFIFNEEELQFTVTVVSDAPITPENVMGTLLQMLRIHGLLLLEQDNNLVIHKSNEVRQMASLVFGNQADGSSYPIVTRVFRLKFANPTTIASIVKPMISNQALIEISQETRQLILTDVTASVDKVAALIENLDAPYSPIEIRTYQTQYNNPEYLIHLTQQIMNPIAQGHPLILVPQSFANTIFIVSTPELNEKAIAVLSTLDIPPQKGGAAAGKGSEVLIIQLSHRQGSDVLQNLKEIANRMQETGGPDASLIDAIDKANWIKETNSLVFVATPSINGKLKDLISSLDAGSTSQYPGKMEGLGGPSQFAVYKVQSANPEDLQDAMKAFASTLSKAKVDPSLVRTIEGMKYIKQTHSILFTGTDDAIKRAQDLAQQFDTGASGLSGSGQFLIYKPQSQSGEEIVRAMKEFKDHLQSSDLRDPSLLRALDSMKWIKSTNSILFTGDPPSLKRIEDLLATIDQPGGGKGSFMGRKTGYRIYKVQNTTGDLIEEDIDNLIKNMQATGMKETPLLKVLENIRYVKETNSLLLTGDEASVAEAESLIAKYDIPHKGAPIGPGNFFMYKPQSQSAAAIEKSLKDIASNLEKSSLADPGLLSAISSMKYIDTTNSLIFTGSPDAIQKIQSLLKDIDVPPQKHAPIQHIGKTTFLLYKLQNASASQITTALKAISTDLKKSGAADKEFIAALNSMKYVRETNSLMFTGSEEALGKVQSLVEKFDVTGLSSPRSPQPSIPSATGPSNFFIYHPQALSAEALVKSLTDFAESLKLSGLNDPDLFQSLESMRFVSNGQSIVFTGNPKTLERIKELLRDFDVPGPQGEEVSFDQTIQSIDNTSFLVYKLQFHRGDEIQGALRQIGKDLTSSNAPINQGLLNSIQSIQWLEVTNSLLCSGDSETLTRLRELIKNLDVPLKQVFIEMLVLQTSLSNAVDFGLEWGGKLKYKDKFSGSFNNLLPTDTVSNGTFSSNLQNITAAPGSRPVPTDIPFSAGFDLGVIGDIIMHKGASFLSLGSLLNAIQNDDETTVVLTPKLIAQDGKSTSIFVGQNVPFAGSFVSNQSSNTVTTSNLEYRNIGFSLDITPVLGNSNIVTLQLSIDSSSETSAPGTGATFSFQAGQATGITTNQATLETTVHVPDRHFFILSGMVNNSNSKQTAGIPCLGGLPLIGAAFSENNQLESLNSLVIFIRPTILNSVDEMKQLTIDQEEFFREQTATPFLEHNFDEAMELIKSPDDE